jgi:hypothetical protein
MKLVERNRTAELLAIDVVALGTQLKAMIDIVEELDTEEDYTTEVAAAKVVINASIEPDPYA